MTEELKVPLSPQKVRSPETSPAKSQQEPRSSPQKAGLKFEFNFQKAEGKLKECEHEGPKANYCLAHNVLICSDCVDLHSDCKANCGRT